MYFKLTQEIAGEYFGKPEYSPMLFEFSKPSVNVCIKTERQKESNVVVIETTMQREPKKNVKKVFVELSEDYYSDPNNTKKLIEDLKERIKREDISGYTLPHDILPSYFLEYCDSVRRDLYSFSSRTYKSIRWVDNLKGDNNPFVNNKLLWSFENSVWNEFNGELFIDLGIKKGLYSSEKFIGVVTDIVQSGNSEPLGHELLREAYSIRTSFPRSALLIAVSAAETGIKQCITSLQPETKWLIENSASPNILKLFREYIPTLSLKVDSDFDLVIPTESILKPLQKSIQMRNIISHGGQCKVKVEQLKIAFDTIKNLLWVIDFFMGNKWAIRHLDDHVKKEMRIE